jgi:hypothetical protein
MAWFTGDRKLTHARLRAGTEAEWERATLDLIPAVPDSDVTAQIARLRELAERRRLLSVTDVVDGGLRGDTMTADEACEILARALERKTENGTGKI